MQPQWDGKTDSSKSGGVDIVRPPDTSIVATNQNKMDNQLRSNTMFHHVRYLILILGGAACGFMFFTRLSITVAMLAMVNHTHLYLAEHPNSTIEDFFPPGYVERGHFNWSNEVQQIILAGYMVSYTLPQVMSVRITMKYGIRKGLTLSLLVCALSCLLAPTSAYWGWQWFLALRLLNGFGASAILPSIIGSIESWMPVQDSAMGLSLFQFVATLFLILVPLVSGQLACIHWEWALYVPGISAAIFALIWWLLVRDTPDLCPFMSQKEIDIINGVQSLGDLAVAGNGEPAKVAKKPRRTDLPWYFMFKIKSFYVFILIWILYCSTYGGMLNLLPSYFHKVLHISVSENGFYMFVIHIGITFSMIWSTPIISLLTKRFKMSLTDARRLIAFIYTFMAVATLGYLAAYHDNQILVISINRFFHMTNDTIVTATLMSQYGQEGLSGLAYSVMNTFGNFGSVIFCWAAGRLLDYTGESLECWSWIFETMAISNVVLFAIYFLFLNSEPIKLNDEGKPKAITTCELKV